MDNIITWGDVYDDYIEHFPNDNAIDYRPFYPHVIYVWLKDGREISYNYKSKRKRDEKKGTWEKWFDNSITKDKAAGKGRKSER